MPNDAVALYATVILLLPMVCFFLASPTFLLVGLKVPEVTQLLRGIFNGYFLAIGIAEIIAMVLFAVSGRPVFSAGAISITAFALTARTGFCNTWMRNCRPGTPASPERSGSFACCI